jgi:hypothetical protein
MSTSSTGGGDRKEAKSNTTTTPSAPAAAATTTNDSEFGFGSAPVTTATTSAASTTNAASDTTTTTEATSREHDEPFGFGFGASGAVMLPNGVTMRIVDDSDGDGESEDGDSKDGTVPPTEGSSALAAALLAAQAMAEPFDPDANIWTAASDGDLTRYYLIIITVHTIAMMLT